MIGHQFERTSVSLSAKAPTGRFPQQWLLASGYTGRICGQYPAEAPDLFVRARPAQVQIHADVSTPPVPAAVWAIGA
jgi:hypothetical protein